jgi:hypothetical protein
MLGYRQSGQILSPTVPGRSKVWDSTQIEGATMKKLFAIFILIIIGIFTVASYTQTPTSKAEVPTPKAQSVMMTPQQQAEKAKQEALKTAENLQWFRDVTLVKAVRQSMKNPASFQLEQVLRMDDGTLCLTYYATNSFNAVIRGRTAIAKGKAVSSGESNFVPFWNKHCGGKAGTDISYIRQAI